LQYRGRLITYLAVLVSTIYTVAMLMFLQSQADLHTILSGTQGDPKDFVAFYTAAKLILSNNINELYNFEFVSRFQQSQLGLQLEQGQLPFIYPPHAALILSPLGLLPLPQAYQLLLLLSCLSMLAVLLLLIKMSDKNASHAALILFAASSPFFLVQLLNGQLSSIYLLLITAYYLAMQKNKDFASASFALLMTVKPTLAFWMPVHMLLLRRWTCFFYWLAGLVLIILLTIAWGGLSLYTDYFSAMKQVSSAPEEVRANLVHMPNFHGLLINLLGEKAFNLINMANMILLMALFGCLATTIRTDSDNWQEFSLLLMLALFFSLWLHMYDLTLTFLPLALLIFYGRAISAIWVLALVQLLMLASLWIIHEAAPLQWLAIIFQLLLIGSLCYEMRCKIKRS